VTMLVHNAALLGVPVDTGRLFDGDELYEMFITFIVEHVQDTYDRMKS